MRRSIFVTCAIVAAGAVLLSGAQKRNAAPSDLLNGIPSGKTRVVDMTYAIDDKLPAWPGDDRTFEAKVNATPEKDGYFTRSFWMLEHYGTHMDAPAHFPPGKLFLDQIPVDHFFGSAARIYGRHEGKKGREYPPAAGRVGKMGGAPRARSAGRDR